MFVLNYEDPQSFSDCLKSFDMQLHQQNQTMFLEPTREYFICLHRRSVLANFILLLDFFLRGVLLDIKISFLNTFVVKIDCGFLFIIRLKYS